jgi:hypothetical protein
LTILARTDDEVALVDGLTRWLLDGVQRAIGVNHEAERLGVGSDHAQVINHLERERNKVEGYRQRRGSGRKVANPFNEERLMEAALAGGRSDSWWLHEVGDQMVHGNYLAHRMRRMAGADGTALLALQTSKPHALADVIAYDCEQPSGDEGDERHDVDRADPPLLRVRPVRSHAKPDQRPKRRLHLRHDNGEVARPAGGHLGDRDSTWGASGAPATWAERPDHQIASHIAQYADRSGTALRRSLNRRR